jgi:Helix-turn-helix domain
MMSAEEKQAPERERGDVESPYLSPNEAAKYLRISVAYLRKLGLGVRLSERRVVYKREDLDDWVNTRRNNG